MGKAIMMQSTSQLGMELDIHVASQPEGSWDEFRALQRDVEQALGRADDLKRSGDYSGTGLVKALGAERQRALTLLEPFRARLTRHDAKVQELITAALSRAPRTAADLPALLAEREIRDLLRGKDPTEVAPLYFKALEQGDHAFIRAVEDAPAAFPLLNNDMRAMGRELQIATSAQASEIAVLRQDRDLIASLVGAALHDIDTAMPAAPEPVATL